MGTPACSPIAVSARHRPKMCRPRRCEDVLPPILTFSEARLGNERPAKYTHAVFTGIVEKMGNLAARESRGPGARLTIATGGSFGSPLVVGESIAVHGPCLTVQTITAAGFECDASAETLARTT